MPLSVKAKQIFDKIDNDNPKANVKGSLRKIAKEIKKDHILAMELWNTKRYFPRMLAILIMDKKLLNKELITKLAKDIQNQEYNQRNELADWLMANQLMKDKKLVNLMETWPNHEIPVLRRLYWYYQARKRWTGKIPEDQDTAELLSRIKKTIAKEESEVQWTMNFTLAQIGLFEKEYRQDCINFGEKLGLYKDDKVSPGYTPSYLPEFIRIEVEKRER